jgi:hypothetical protein
LDCAADAAGGTLADTGGAEVVDDIVSSCLSSFCVFPVTEEGAVEFVEAGEVVEAVEGCGSVG